MNTFFFIAAIGFFILRANFVSLLLGWDGLGLVSYLLITYYYSKYSINSGLITLLINRFGDVNLILLISLLREGHNWRYFRLKDSNSMAIIFIIIASFSKSAQIPFSAWLPQAIAAPTPVSSLVHSSTLVTAGIYLALRNFIFLNLKFLQTISSITLLIARFIALLEYDFKKIIALSTLSQIALIFLSIIKFSLNIAFFHLLTHAIFKCLLFLTRGSVLHSFKGLQDIRLLNFFFYSKPLNYNIITRRLLSLIGIPFLSGFFSKDLIFENSYFLSHLVLISVIVRIFLTAIYSSKIILFLFYPLIKMNLFEGSEYNEISFSCFFLWVSNFFLGFLYWQFKINYFYFYKICNEIKTLPLIIVALGVLVAKVLQQKNLEITTIVGLFLLRTRVARNLINLLMIFLLREIRLLMSYSLAIINFLWAKPFKTVNIKLLNLFLLVVFFFFMIYF